MDFVLDFAAFLAMAFCFCSCARYPWSVCKKTSAGIGFWSLLMLQDWKYGLEADLGDFS